MRALALGIMAALMCSGCANRTPLRSVRNIGQAALHIDNQTKAMPRARAVTSEERNRNLSTSEGLFGMMVVSMAASGHTTSSQHEGETLLHWLQRQNGFKEGSTFDEALKRQLQEAGLAWSNQNGQPTLAVNLESVDLRESQRGYWEAAVKVSAKLLDAGEKQVWKVSVIGSSSTSRSPKEFFDQPALYARDLQEAVDDATRQMISGPIRK